MPSSRSLPRGFTLVEMAVVLLVAGLLLVGVLSGQALLTSMRVKDLVATAGELSEAAARFRERFHFLPGDFPLSAAPNQEITGLTGICATGGNGDGEIRAAQASGPLTLTESACAPVHLYRAGFVRKASVELRSPYGAVRIVGNSVAAGSTVASGPNPVPATVRNLIELDLLPCDVALEVDLKLDDGNLATGKVRASVATCTAGAGTAAVPSLAIPL